MVTRTTIPLLYYSLNAKILTENEDSSVKIDGCIQMCSAASFNFIELLQENVNFIPRTEIQVVLRFSYLSVSCVPVQF